MKIPERKTTVSDVKNTLNSIEARLAIPTTHPPISELKNTAIKNKQNDGEKGLKKDSKRINKL